MSKPTPQHYLANIEYENAHDALRGARRQLKEISHFPLDDYSELKQEALERLRTTIEAEISALREGYEKTGNPLFLWCTYLACRWAQHPIPESVLSYLDDCAENLIGHVESLRTDEVLQKGTRGNMDPGKNCLEALGLSQNGQLNAFVRMKQHWAEKNVFKDLQAAEEVELARGHPSTKAKGIAIKTVRADHEKKLKKKAISESQLRRIYEENKKT